MEQPPSNPSLGECFLFPLQPRFPCGPNPFLRTMVEAARPSRQYSSVPGIWQRVTADRTSPSAWVKNPLPVSVSCHCSFNSPSPCPPGFAHTSCPPKLHLLRGCTEPGCAGPGRAEAGRAVAAAASVSPSPRPYPCSTPSLGLSTGGESAAGRAGLRVLPSLPPRLLLLFSKLI